MKKLTMLALVALLSFGLASVSWAQEGAAAGQAAGGEMKAGKAPKKHKAKKKKKSKKGSKAEAPAGEMK
jgi:hypothetical protein